MGKARNSGPSSRPVQVGEQIRQVLGQMLLDGSIKDPRVQKASLVTVTEVRMTRDLQLGRVLVSVFPEDDTLVASVFEGLGSARPEMQREIGRRLRLRFIPELRFLVDDSMAYGARIEAVLKEINTESPEANGSDTSDD